LGTNNASKPHGKIQKYIRSSTQPPTVAIVAISQAAIQSDIRQRNDIWGGSSEFMPLPTYQVGPRHNGASTANFNNRLLFLGKNDVDRKVLCAHSDTVTTEILTLCFAARPGAQGEINILGATDMILVPQFPVAISCFIVGKLRFQKVEEGMKEIKFSIIDSDGNELQPPPPPQQIQIQIPQGGSSAGAAIVVGIPNLLIPHPGEYEVNLAVNGRQEMTIPIFVQQVSVQGTLPPI